MSGFYICIDIYYYTYFLYFDAVPMIWNLLDFRQDFQ